MNYNQVHLRHHRIMLPIGFLMFLACSSLQAQEVTPFVYQGIGSRKVEKAAVEYETGYSTREAREISEPGVLHELRAAVALTKYITAELGGGTLLPDDRKALYSFHLDALIALLDEKISGINLGIALGFIRDYRNTNIPRLRVAIDKTIGDFRLAASGLMEFPLGGFRCEK